MTVEPRYVEERPSQPVELEPFTRFNWKTAESRDLWSGPLERFASAKHEAEWRSVMSSNTDRRAAIVHINNHNRERWLRRIGDHGLYYRDIRYSKPYDGFAHKHHDTTRHDPNRITYSVIAENRDILDKMYEAELEMEGFKRHNVVGELLGFPQCCRDFFNETWVSNTDIGLVDHIYEIACNTPSAEIITDEENIRITDPNAYCNAIWRYFGWGFITHFPCSFECEKSAEIGEARREIMEMVGYREAAEMGYEWLDTPHVWDALHSIANVRNMHVTGTASSSSYWSKKRVEWKRENLPRMKDVYTEEDLSEINA